MGHERLLMTYILFIAFFVIVSGAFITDAREAGVLPPDVDAAMNLSRSTEYYLYHAHVPTEDELNEGLMKEFVETKYTTCELCIDGGFVWRYLPPWWTDFRDHSKQLKYIGWCQPNWDGCGKTAYWKIRSLDAKYNKTVGGTPRRMLSDKTIWRSTSCFNGTIGDPIEVIKCPVEVEPGLSDRH